MVTENEYFILDDNCVDKILQTVFIWTVNLEFHHYGA